MKLPPQQQPITEPSGSVNMIWQEWFYRLWQIAHGLDESGTTAQRPVKWLYKGKMYFDTTLNKPIWLKSVNPTVWVTADGIAS